MLYRSLIREIEAAGDISSLQSSEEAKLMNPMIVTIQKKEQQKRHRRKARRDEYAEQSELPTEAQRLLRNSEIDLAASLITTQKQIGPKPSIKHIRVEDSRITPMLEKADAKSR